MKKNYIFFALSVLTFSDMHSQYQMLDSTFNTDGIVTTNIDPLGDYINAIAIQTDQKIVAAGNANNAFVVARYNTDGSLDASFGTGGSVITPIGSFSSASSVAIQADGKIVAGGAGLVSNLDFAVVRYNTNGTLDMSFDTDGIAIVAIGTGHDSPRAMIIQPDGKIILGGRSASGSVTHFALVRLNTDGSPDLTFGAGGMLTTAFGSTSSDIYSIALQTDNKILATGSYTTTGPAGNDIALARYNTNGSLDATFGTAGKLNTNIDGDGDIGKKILVQTDGKILVTGDSNFSATQDDIAVLRYNSDGTLDNTFGTGGIVTTDYSGDNDLPNSMVLQPDGKIIVAGYSYPGTSMLDFAVVRYNSNGTLDNTFGTGGKLWTEMGTGSNTISDVLLQADGKIVVGGAINTGTSTSEFALARYINTLSTGLVNLSSSGESIHIFPNPGNGKFQVTTGNFSSAGNFQIEIYNVVGEKVLQQRMEKEIDISQSPKGLYFVKIYDGVQVYTNKIVVE